MARFTDKLKREWDITITRGDLRRAREQEKIELGKLLADREAFAEVIFGNPEKLFRLLVVLLGSQMKEQGVDEFGLEDGFDGPTALAATDALVEALADFDQPRVADQLKATIRGGMEKATAAMRAEAGRRMAVAEAEMDRKLNELLTTSSIASNSQALPDSPTTG